MNYAIEITKALEHVPNQIAVIVLTDIDKRISDWLSSGGDKNAPYIHQQVNYAKQIGKKYGQKKDTDRLQAKSVTHIKILYSDYITERIEHEANPN